MTLEHVSIKQPQSNSASCSMWDKVSINLNMALPRHLLE